MAAGVRARLGQRTGPPYWLIAGFTLGAVGLGAWASIKGPEELGALPVLLAGFMLVPVWMFVTHKPAHALAVLLLYMGLLDGFLKLRVSAGNELPTIGRDVLLYSLAIGMVVRAILRRKPLDLPPLSVWVFLWVAVILIQVLNPANQSLVHAIASTRQHLEFVPLFFIGYTVIRTRARLRGFLMIFLVVAAANGMVGLIQWNLTPEQLSNWGPGYRGLITGESGVAPRTAEGADGSKRVRPMALGSDMGFGGAVGGVALPSALALLAAAGWRRRYTYLAALMGLGAVVGVATSQSRTSVVSTVFGIAAFVALGVSARRAPKLIGTMVVVGVLSILALGQISGDKQGAFSRYESVTPKQALSTTLSSRKGFWIEVPDYAKDFPTGAGLGVVGPAAGVIDPPGNSGLSAESQFTFTIVELGIPGLLILVGFYLHLLGRVTRRIRRLADKDLRLLLAALAAPLFLFISGWIVGPTTCSSPGAPWMWFAAGVLLWWTRDPDLRLPDLRTPAHETEPSIAHERLSYSH